MGEVGKCREDRFDSRVCESINASATPFLEGSRFVSKKDAFVILEVHYGFLRRTRTHIVRLVVGKSFLSRVKFYLLRLRWE